MLENVWVSFSIWRNAANVVQKTNRLGVGIQEYYSICAVIGLLEKGKAAGVPNPTCEYMAADRCARMIKKMLSLQDNFSAAATLASLPNMVCDLVIRLCSKLRSLTLVCPTSLSPRLMA